MSPEIIIGLIGSVTTIGGSFLTWLLAKRRYDAEVDKDLIENMKSSMDFYDNLTKNNKEKLTEVIEENGQLRKRVEELSNENIALKEQLDELKVELHRRDALIESLNKRIDEIMGAICTDLMCQLRKKGEEEIVEQKRTKKSKNNGKN